MRRIDLAGFAITGANGMIGSAIPWGTKLSRRELDLEVLSDLDARMDAFRPTGILNLAALDIRQCEQKPLLASKVNAWGAFRLAEYAKQRGIPYIFLSSATVFNGTRGTRFFEDSAPNPLNVYGETKRLAETLIQKAYPAALIIRTGWVFGGHGAHHRKFVDLAIQKAKAGEPIEAADQQDGSPTFVRDLVSTLSDLVGKSESGIWHVVNDGQATALDMARVIVESLKSHSRIDVRLNAYFQGTPAGTPERSPSEVLGSRRIGLRHWKEALSEMIHSAGI